MSAVASTPRREHERRMFLEHPAVTAMQRKHFILYEALPFAVAIAAIPVLFFTGLTTLDLVMFAVLWLCTCIGIEIGYHRYFAHASFRAPRWFQVVLLVFGALAGEGTAGSWASNHRHHHRYADTPQDTHSPFFPPVGRARGMLHAQVTWKLRSSYVNPSLYIPTLMRDQVVAGFAPLYPFVVAAGLVGPAVVGGLVSQSIVGSVTGFLFAGVIRMVLVQQSTFAVNSITHGFGTRPYRTKDRSTNNALLVPLTMGAAWHNNHHAFPMSATNQHRWWQLDPGWFVLWLLQWVGVVSHVNRPSTTATAAKVRLGQDGEVGR
jgi:stearoyl-CoA desaturase (delta-9 desaturase)